MSSIPFAYWSYLLHDVADNIERTDIYEPPELALLAKLHEWHRTLTHIIEGIADQRDYLE